MATLAAVGDVLNVDRAALLIHELTSTPGVPVPVATVAERILAASGTEDAAGAEAVAQSLFSVFGGGAGEADASVLACGMALLSDATPSERLKLAFRACDRSDSGFVTAHRLAPFIGGFSQILVAAFERITAATATAMGAPAGNTAAQAALLKDTMSTMKKSVASLSRSAKELWSPHGVGVADFQIWALGHHSIAVWVNRLAAVWSARILGLSTSVAGVPHEAGLSALQGAPPLLSAPKLTELLGELRGPGNAASLRERLFVMHAPEDGQNLKKKQVAVSLVLLMEGLEPAQALEAIAQMQQSAEASSPMEGVSISDVTQALSTLSREVADGLLVCCSLLVTGRPKGGVSRPLAFEHLDPHIRAAAESVADAVVRVATESGEMTPESFAKAVSTNEELLTWVANLSEAWRGLCLLYNPTFCRALRVRHASVRGHVQETAEGGGEGPAAVKIQAMARGATYRKKMLRAGTSATVVQSMWRMIKAKRAMGKTKGKMSSEEVWEREHRLRIERLRRNEAEMMAMKQVPANAVEGWSAPQPLLAHARTYRATRSPASRVCSGRRHGRQRR